MPNKKTTPGPDLLLSLVEFAKSVDLREVVWEQGPRRIAFKRGAPEPAPAPVAAAAPAAAPAPAPRKVKSPMVGTFLRAPQDRPPLVVEGGQVKVGQKLAVVEAMNIIKDVVSPADGRIAKILVENGRPVEYGQDLFELEA